MAQVRPLPSIAPAPPSASQRTHAWMSVTPLIGGSRFRCMRCGEIQTSPFPGGHPPPSNWPDVCAGGITCPLCDRDDGTQAWFQTAVWRGICCKPCSERVAAVQIRPLRCGGCVMHGRDSAAEYFVLLPDGGYYLCEDCTELAQLGKPLA